MVDLLFLVPSDGVNQVYQLTVEDIGCRFDQFRLRLFTVVITWVCTSWLSGQLQGFGFDPIRIDGIKQAIDQMRQLNTLCRLLNSGLFIGIKLLVQASQSSSQGADGIGIAGTHHHAHSQIFERY